MYDMDTNLLMLVSFIGLMIALIALSGDSCHAENNLFDTSKTTLFGSVCTNTTMFWIVCMIAILVQIGRNILWIKNSQATREALKEKRSNRNLLPLMGYTLASTTLHILSILVILGGNIIVLISVMIGNLIGVALSVSEQDADKERMTTALLNIQCRWDKLSTSDNRTKEEEKEYKELKILKQWVREWILEQETPNTRPPNDPAYRLRI